MHSYTESLSFSFTVCIFPVLQWELMKYIFPYREKEISQTGQTLKSGITTVRGQSKGITIWDTLFLGLAGNCVWICYIQSRQLLLDNHFPW